MFITDHSTVTWYIHGARFRKNKKAKYKSKIIFPNILHTTNKCINLLSVKMA